MFPNSLQKLIACGFAALVAAGSEEALAIQPIYDHMLSLPSAVDRIGYPKGVTADINSDEIFVCDSRKQRLLIFDTSGFFKFQIRGGDRFEVPLDIAIDPEGFLFLLASRLGTWEILKLDFDGKPLGTIAIGGDFKRLKEARIVSLAISPLGDYLYALDAENLLLWILRTSGEIERAVDLASHLEEEARDDEVLRNVDVYDDTVIVPLAMTGEILTFDLDGNSTGRVGVKGMATCKLAFPTAAGILPSGRLLVLDQQKMVVTVWDSESNQCLGEYGGLGSKPGDLYFPNNLSIHPDGQVYISQGYEGRVQVFSGFGDPE